MRNRNSYLKKIGGKNDIVEIDESKSCKRKYNKGHQAKGTWIVDGISRKTKKVFMIPVKVRDAETLTSIIKKHVLPETTVYTDCWKGYNKLKLYNYIHKTVNHSNLLKILELVFIQILLREHGMELKWVYQQEIEQKMV
jgi:transposase-like protein